MHRVACLGRSRPPGARASRPQPPGNAGVSPATPRERGRLARNPPGTRASRPQPYSWQRPFIQNHSLAKRAKPALKGFTSNVAGRCAGGTPALPGGSRPQPYCWQQPCIQGHSLAKRAKPAFKGFKSNEPGRCAGETPAFPGGHDAGGTPALPGGSRPQPYCWQQPFIQGHSLGKRATPAFKGFTSNVAGRCAGGTPAFPGGHDAGGTPALPGGSRPQPYSWQRPFIQNHSLGKRAKPAFKGFTSNVAGRCAGGTPAFPGGLDAGGTPALPGGSRPQPYCWQQPCIQGHSLAKRAKPALKGFKSNEPGRCAGETPALPGGSLRFLKFPFVDNSVYPCSSATISRAAFLAFSGWSGGKEMAATTGCPPPP